MNAQQKKIVGQIGNWSKLFAITLIFSIFATIYWTGEMMFDIFGDFSVYQFTYATYFIDNIIDIVINVLTIVLLFRISNEFTAIKSIKYDFWDMGFDMIRKLLLFILIIRIISWAMNIIRRILEVFLF